MQLTSKDKHTNEDWCRIKKEMANKMLMQITVEDKVACKRMERL